MTVSDMNIASLLDVFNYALVLIYGPVSYTHLTLPTKLEV